MAEFEDVVEKEKMEGCFLRLELGGGREKREERPEGGGERECEEVV